MLLFFLFIALPILELTGFSIAVHEIGLGYTILWVIADIFIGSSILVNQGAKALQDASASINNDTYPLKEMFDAICIVIGSILLIFPGFVTDIFALIFIIPPIRYGIYLLLKSQNESALEEFTKSSESYTSKYYGKKVSNGEQVIEAEYTVIKDEKLDD